MRRIIGRTLQFREFPSKLFSVVINSQLIPFPKYQHQIKKLIEAYSASFLGLSPVTLGM
jgi:hypothetical protein